MKIKKPALALAALLLCGGASAQAKPDYSLSYNLGVVTDYRFRGISQTSLRPALQGGADWTHAGGTYLGAWASTIRWIKDSSAPGISVRGPIELDLYGGYKGSISEAVSFDVGGLFYWYVDNSLSRVTGENANTFELYGALSAGPATVKYSHALTPLFGAPGSKNSGYLDVSASFDVGNGFSVVPHVGWQRIRGFGTYMDYSVTLAKDLGNGLSVTGAVVGTNWKSHFGFPYTLPGSGTRDLGRTGLVLGLKKAF